MKTMNVKKYCFLGLLAAGLVSWSLSGCGGGGGRGGGGAGAVATGSVNVLLADGPADEFDSIHLKVTEVTLLSDGHDPVVLFRSAAGHEVDLLELRDEDFVLTVRRNVPAREYQKIRIRVRDIRVEGGPCSDMEIKLPSGKIDLNPRGGFEVEPGRTLTVRLDVDANKSIHLHPAGSSGRCIFRPVVFVEIEKGRPIRRCPRAIRGTITKLITDDDDDDDIDDDDDDDGDASDGGNGGLPVGFLMDLRRDSEDLEVELADGAVIFDASGLPAGADALAVGQDVIVRGRFDDDGELEASVVVIGDVLVVDGVISGGDIVIVGGFLLTPDPGEAILDEVEVRLADETLVLGGCNRAVDRSLLRPGARVRVIGKLLAGEDLIRAAAVLVRPSEIRGDLLEIEGAAGGHKLTIHPDGAPDEGEESTLDVFLPDTVGIFLEGDGRVPLRFLSALLECGSRRVRVVLDDDKLAAVAAAVSLQSDGIEGEVVDLDLDDSTLVVGETKVRVRPGATVLDLRSEATPPVLLDEIDVGDDVRIFGLEGCDENTFHGFVILILAPDDDGGDA